MLRELDDRLVPRLALGLRRLLGRVPGARSRLPEPVAVPLPRTPGPDPLDEQVRGGLLGLVRDVPQLAALVVAAIFLSAGALVLDRAGDERAAERLDVPGVDEPEPVAPSSVLGPEVGADVTDYLSRARQDVAALAQRDGGDRYIALVLLSDYVTPAALKATLGEFGVGRVYLRAPVAGDLAEVIAVPTPSDPVEAVRTAYARAVADKREEALNLRSQADSLDAPSVQDAESKATFLADAERVEAEATAYAGDCACVFAAVVEGSAAGLARLLERPAVRGVEVAGRGSELASLEVRPLWPEQRGVVPTPPP